MLWISSLAKKRLNAMQLFQIYQPVHGTVTSVKHLHWRWLHICDLITGLKPSLRGYPCQLYTVIIMRAYGYVCVLEEVWSHHYYLSIVELLFMWRNGNCGQRFCRSEGTSRREFVRDPDKTTKVQPCEYFCPDVGWFNKLLIVIATTWQLSLAGCFNSVARLCYPAAAAKCGWIWNIEQLMDNTLR